MENTAGGAADAIIASAVRAYGHTLTPYQRAFLDDAAPFRAVLKARQTGFSWLFALEALAHALAEGHFSIFVSLNREEAAEKIRYARDLYEALPETNRPRLVSAGFHELRFEGGGRLLSFPCRAPRGKAGASVYLDEMAFYPHSEAVYSGALPVVTHGGRVTVASTPNGDRGMFWRIVSEPNLVARYSQHRIPWWHAPWLCRDTAAADADCEGDTEARVQRYGTEVLDNLYEAMDREAFQQEYELRFVDSNEAFLSWEEIEANAQDIPLAGTWADLARMGGPVYAGVDIGRVLHATEIIAVRVVSGQYVVSAIKSMAGADFEQQEAAVCGCLQTGGAVRMCLDATGIGRPFSEKLARSFPRQIEPVVFTTRNKDDMARRLKRALQDGTLVVPRLRAHMDQLHAVRRLFSESGNARYDAPAKGTNHADQFWALAMALHAACATTPTMRGRTIRG